MRKPPIDKIQIYEAEEFRVAVDDDPKRAEFWLENAIRVFDELSCTPSECVKCAVSLLKDVAYQKKYISQRFLDQKRKEFLELKQGHMTISEYEREFVRLNKYARECIRIEVVMCKRFEDRLNEDIKLLVEILKLKEFVVLVGRAHKAEELRKEKRKGDSEAKDSRKRSTGKSYHSSSKKSMDFHNCSIASVGYFHQRSC
ncbi:uncharacterized protein LOC128033887 [Gossypium raimondii]|uniref:uncharacterized protein LOC128033887 n=1 Tax=Gossypium raimondii TaxID=29730 RepID=UPI00227A33D3|nr:uncharacterized protein LOC128033887 [Gossypium raimondii]